MVWGDTLESAPVPSHNKGVDLLSTRNNHQDGSSAEPSQTVYHKGHGQPAPAGGLPQPKPQPRMTLATAVGNLLYDLGFAAEYRVVQAWRILRNAGLMLGQVVLWLFGLLFGWIVTLARGVWKDLTEPLRHVRRQRRQQLAEGDLAKVRVKASLRFFSMLVALLLPVAATAGFVLIVYHVATMQYALAVEIDGQVIGYVADQTVVDSAKSLLRDRLRLAENQEASDWQFNPTYSIARASSYTTTQQLVNEILRVGSENPGDIMSATGLYINDQLYAVTEDGGKLKQYLDEYLEQKTAEADPDAHTVSYVNNIVCDPDSEEVFFTDSVISWDEMLEKLNSNISEAKYVVADGQATLAQIAAGNNISQSEILSRNPDLAESGVDYVPEAGKSIKVQNAEPLMQTQEIFRRSSIVDIPYDTIEQENPNMAYGTRMPLQEGVTGRQEVWDDVSVIDGEEQPGVRVETIVIQPAVDEIMEVGTNQETVVSSDEYMFPVPSSTWSSRGISSYHRGLDINAPTGEPIFACQEGTVVTAGWHYSYGYHVVINHPDGMTTLYAHCSSLDVEAGEQVVQGQLIGRLGSTGNSSGPHCHLEFQRDGALLNPLDYITIPPGYRLGRG